jgi:hypothetical protein
LSSENGLGDYPRYALFEGLLITEIPFHRTWLDITDFDLPFFEKHCVIGYGYVESWQVSPLFNMATAYAGSKIAFSSAIIPSPEDRMISFPVIPG